MKLSNLSALKIIAVRPGSVFKMVLYPSDGVVPKGKSDMSRTKYFVIIGKDEDSILVGSLLINTDININMIDVIAPYQHCIYPEDYDFLGGKYRYIDCYRIKELDIERIIDEATFVGNINPEDLKKSILLANRSPVNKPLILKKYGVLKEVGPDI